MKLAYSMNMPSTKSSHAKAEKHQTKAVQSKGQLDTILTMWRHVHVCFCARSGDTEYSAVVLAGLRAFSSTASFELATANVLRICCTADVHVSDGSRWLSSVLPFCWKTNY